MFTEVTASLDERVAAIVADSPEIVAVDLFGSRARGQGRAGSDLDVAVVFARDVDRTARFQARCLLSERLARSAGCATADVVDLETATPLLAHEVLRGGRLLWSGDERRRVEVVARQTMRYIDGAPMRRVLDEATFRRLREGRIGRLA
jgi:predicted nucleotidyltransferase